MVSLLKKKYYLYYINFLANSGREVLNKVYLYQKKLLYTLYKSLYILVEPFLQIICPALNPEYTLAQNLFS